MSKEKKFDGAGNYTVCSYLYTLVSVHRRSTIYTLYLKEYFYTLVPQMANFAQADMLRLWHMVLTDVKVARCTKVIS